jgi:hypothetical protein
MIHSIHYFSDLFNQLGLPSDSIDIMHFLAANASMNDNMRLPDAAYWTPSQAAFLRESLLQDSEWSGLVDQLSLALQGPVVELEALDTAVSSFVNLQ